jgi:hypothetical protein
MAAAAAVAACCPPPTTSTHLSPTGWMGSHWSGAPFACPTHSSASSSREAHMVSSRPRRCDAPPGLTARGRRCAAARSSKTSRARPRAGHKWCGVRAGHKWYPAPLLPRAGHTCSGPEHSARAWKAGRSARTLGSTGGGAVCRRPRCATCRHRCACPAKCALCVG